MESYFDGRKDKFQINAWIIARDIVPNRNFDENHNPLYSSTNSQRFIEMSEKDLDFWIGEITNNLRLKWSEAQKEKAKKDV